MIRFTHESPTCPELVALFDRLDQELCQLYQKQQLDSDAHNQLDVDDFALVAWLDDRAVACGAYREIATCPDSVEIKRMYVDRSLRRTGIASQLLQRLERHASANGFCRARLETGVLQHEAISLYQRRGYVRIQNFPPYEEKATSICMEKRLT